jgi:hypothetical protein
MTVYQPSPRREAWAFRQGAGGLAPVAWLIIALLALPIMGGAILLSVEVDALYHWSQQ